MLLQRRRKMTSKNHHGLVYDLSEDVMVEEIDESIIREFVASQKAYTKGFVRLQPYNQVMPRVYATFDRRMREFQVRDDDVWIGSFPKSGGWIRNMILRRWRDGGRLEILLQFKIAGTTWTEEMVWCIMNDLDYEAAKMTTLDERIPFVE